MELRHEAIDGLEKVPDGILSVYKSNSKSFDYKF